MGTLPDTIAAALLEPEAPLWLPDITDALATMGWRTLHLHTGITMLNYGTSRVVAGDSCAPRHVVARLSFHPEAPSVASCLRIECLVDAAARRYQDVGLTFYLPEEITNTTILDCLQEAIDTVAHVPTLHRTVATLVRVCHLVKPEDDDCDVSYSDPQLPFSIFVSIPSARSANDALRVAESLVHEAMHLQLTLIERATSLVHPSDATYFSPWKGTHRSPQGVLHALYVFRVIDQYFERLLALPGWSCRSMDHMRHRRREIAAQVREIETFKDSPALTGLGTRLVQRLIGE